MIACSKLVVCKVILLVLAISLSTWTRPSVSASIGSGTLNVSWGNLKLLRVSKVLQSINNFSILNTSLWKDFLDLVTSLVNRLLDDIWSFEDDRSIFVFLFNHALRVCLVTEARLFGICNIFIVIRLPLRIETLLFKSEKVIFRTFSIALYLYSWTLIF
jgi:hypothetical protein